MSMNNNILHGGKRLHGLDEFMMGMQRFRL